MRDAGLMQWCSVGRIDRGAEHSVAVRGACETCGMILYAHKNTRSACILTLLVVSDGWFGSLAWFKD